MKFLKANLVLLICVLAVVLAIGALYYPIGAKSKQLRAAMTASLGSESMAHSLGNTFIRIPGEKSYNGPVTPKVIQAKKYVQQQIAAQANRVRQRVEFANAVNRVRFYGRRVLPLLNGVPMRELLPRPSRDAVIRGEFRSVYRRLFLPRNRNHRGFLAMLDAGSPPSEVRIHRLLRRALKKQASIMPLGETGAGNNGEHVRLMRQIVRRAVYRIASGIKVYASPRSFQVRRFIRSTRLPTADQIYEAFVDTWLQSDVVRTIAVLNASSDNVGESPIKRLIHITVGNAAPAAMVGEPNNASSGFGPVLVGDDHLFFGGGKLAQSGAMNAGGVAPGGIMGGGVPSGVPGGVPGGYPGIPGFPTPGAGFPGAGNMSSSGMTGTSSAASLGAVLTGHVSNTRYQVVLMEVSLVAEPWAVNKFINELYRQNNGYIVLNMNIRTVDPIRAITRGYVYGKVPAVRADILVECVLFTRWNRLVMPSDYRAALSLTSNRKAQ